MLVVTRRPDEDLIVLNDIIITVVKVAGNRVTLGITAPNDVKVYRREVLERDTDGQKILDEIKRRAELEVRDLRPLVVPGRGGRDSRGAATGTD